MSPKQHTVVSYMTQKTKDKFNFIISGNQVYRGVEVDYSTYQQQSATIRTATPHLSWC
jgi:hypothetical protein